MPSQDRTDILLCERREGVLLLTLNRPGSLNALSSPLRRALIAALRDAQADPTIRAIVLTGAGRAFCAGLDLKELAQSPDSVASQVADENIAAAIASLTKPLIGAINGVAVTGGLEIALACDLLVASSEASFADTHVRVGLAPGWGLSQRLSRAIGVARAKEMSLTGKRIPAALAYDWGLVNHVVEPDALRETALTLAAEISANEPDQVSRMRRLIDCGFDLPLSEALAFEAAEADRHNRVAVAGGTAASDHSTSTAAA